MGIAKPNNNEKKSISAFIFVKKDLKLTKTNADKKNSFKPNTLFEGSMMHTIKNITKNNFSILNAFIKIFDLYLMRNQ